MSSNSDSTCSETPSETSRYLSDEPKILLFMETGRNRELLLDVLEAQYHVQTTVDVDALESTFDCCIFDYSEFNRVAGTIQSKRETTSPVFLPFVLLIGENDPHTSNVELREYVDDVIDLPTKKGILISRIDNLVKRRRTAAELAERELRLEQTVSDLKLKEQAMDEAPVGITITDPDQDDNPLIYVNKQFQDLTGYTDVIGENCRFLQGDGTDFTTRAKVRDAISDQRAISIDILNYRKSGRKFWNKLEIAPIRDDDGAVTNFVGFQTDITERKIRERRLEVLNRVLSHNLRNKMNVIEGHISLLRQSDGTDTNPDSLSLIQSTATDILELAETIQDIDRALSTQSAIEIDLGERTEQLVSAFKDRFPEATIKLTHPREKPLRITVPGLMAAIEEALQNAVQHNESSDAFVEIRIERQDKDWIDIEIEDNGPGIPKQEVEVLREGETPLKHADRLGLWFMYWVVSRVGGRFSTTESERGGTTVTLSIPQSDER